MTNTPLNTSDWCALLGAPGARAGLIGPDNESNGGANLDDALRSGSAFAIAIRDDVVAVDVDDERPEVLGTLIDVMRLDGRDVVAFRSGRPGHHHLYVVCSSASDAENASTRLLRLRESLGSVDFTVLHRGYLRPPGAPHRLGTATSPVPVFCSADAIARLRAHAPARWRSQRRDDGALESMSTNSSMRLGNTTCRLLVHGDGLDGYESRSEAVAALLWGMRRAGFTFEQVRAALDSPANHGGEPWRSIRRGDPRRDGTLRRNPERWLRRVWEDTCAKVEPSASVTERHHVEYVDCEDAAWLTEVEAIVRREAPRRLSSTMLVAMALAASTKNEDGTLSASERTLAEMCLLDSDTVHRALSDLSTWGPLEQATAGRIDVGPGGIARPTPSTWRLVTDSAMVTTPQGGLPDSGTGQQRVSFPEDVVVGGIDGALSPPARYLFIRLFEQPMTVAECADLLGMKERSLLLPRAGARRRGGPVRQLLDLGLARINNKGQVVPRRNVTKRAVKSASQVRLHGRVATHRRRAMVARHQRERNDAVATIRDLKASVMRDAIRRFYCERRGLRPLLAQRIARETVAKRGLTSRNEHHPWRRLSFRQDGDRADALVALPPNTVLVRPGDSTITRRVRAAGAQKVWVRRHPFNGASATVWRVVGYVISRDELVECLHGLSRLEERLTAPRWFEGRHVGVIPDLEDARMVLSLACEERHAP